MSNIGSYEDRYETFNWTQAAEELGFGKDWMHNIGYFCSERICEKGLGKKQALLWEGFNGEVKQYTFDDIRRDSNWFAHVLGSAGLKPGDRICLFMDRIPELYLGFLGVLKFGAVAQPLFSAFGEESLFVRLDDAKTRAIITQRKHVGKIRKILDQIAVS